MTLEQLRIFIAIAEREHLTQAAQFLSLTPSAVSASLRLLEERYGTPLFDRVGRRIELNEAGRIFLAEARATIARARAAELTLSELGGLTRGTLVLQASQTIASYWLPEKLIRFRQSYPQIDIQLTIGNTEKVARSVLEGEADLGFVEGAIEADHLDVKTVGQDQIVAVVAPGHPWLTKKKLLPADLPSGLWILRETGSGTRAAFKTMLAHHGIDFDTLQIALTLPSNEAVRSAVLVGSYATVVSELVVASHIQAGLLCRLKIDLPRRSFFSVRHQDRYKSRAVAAFEQIIRTSGSDDALI